MRSRKFLFYGVRMGKPLPDIKYCEVLVLYRKRSGAMSFGETHGSGNSRAQRFSG